MSLEDVIVPHDQAFQTFYDNLEEKPLTTIRIFDRNEYYTVHEKDAEFVAKEIFKTAAVLKKHKGSDKFKYVNLSKNNFESLVKDLLLVRHYCVEIYRRNSKKYSEWVLDCKGTPGNLTEVEDLLFNSCDVTESRGIIAVKLKCDKNEILVGVSYADAISRKFQVMEFSSDSHLSTLQSVLVHLSPKECLIQSGNDEKVRELMKRNNILVSACKSSHFSDKDLIQDLNRLLKFGKGEQKQVTSKTEFDLSLAMNCTSAIIKYLELLKDEGNFGQFVLSQFHPEQYMKLDSSAVKALGIIPNNQREGDKTPTILSLLNKCRTAGGQRLLSQWLKQPLMDIAKIEERLDAVNAFVQNTEIRQTLHDNNLRRVPDLLRFGKKFQKKKASLQDCYKTYLMLENLPHLIDLLDNDDGPYKLALQSQFCQPIKELENDFQKYQEMIQTTIDLDQAEKGDFLVRSDFDSDLKELREQLDELEEDMRADLKKVAKDLEIEVDKVIKLEKAPQIGWFYRITRKDEKVLRNRKNYFTIDTKTNGVRFHSANLRQLNSTFVSLRDDIEKHQKKLVDLIVDIAAGYCDPMYVLNDIIARLDVLVAFSVVAVSAPKPFVRPSLLPKGTGLIKLKKARHPLVEIQKPVGFIANDCTLDTDSSHFQIITGPNMGGKSTYIRSVAVNVLLAQIGSFVACDDAKITIVDAIMTRVGAGDKQLRGISTFMGEMLETSSILRTATKDSLIIIDELGRGTSTYDGFGLAWAISEHIVTEIGALCFFATHFHELTALAKEYPKVKNLHVTALTSEDCFTLLYQVKPGVCDRSFGIHVAELAQFPKHIINMAKEKVAEFDLLQGHGSILGHRDGLSPKKRKLDEEEAEVVISNFFDKIKTLKTSGESDESILVEVKRLKTELKNCQNVQIQQLLQQ